MPSRLLQVATGLIALAFATSCPALAFVFPADQKTIALMVAAAFLVPALIAGVLALLDHIRRTLGPVLSGVVCVLALVALAGYLHPGLLALLGI
ncbi:MAG: hypothetical protein ACM31O_00620 [Bacteroidota bacterium]|jgi:hypothetical protein